MKIVSMMAMLCLFAMVFAAARAADVKESDYPNQYEVLMSNKSSKLLVDKSCTMTLRDKAKPNVAINVAKNGYGSCETLANGKVYRGREDTKKNELELIVLTGDKKTKSHVESWRIIGTVDINPGSDRPTS